LYVSLSTLVSIPPSTSLTTSVPLSASVSTPLSAVVSTSVPLSAVVWTSVPLAVRAGGILEIPQTVGASRIGTCTVLKAKPGGAGQKPGDDGYRTRPWSPHNGLAVVRRKVVHKLERRGNGQRPTTIVSSWRGLCNPLPLRGIDPGRSGLPTEGLADSAEPRAQSPAAGQNRLGIFWRWSNRYTPRR
jgi:hypothetical protein